MFQYILFDLDNTLYDFELANQNALNQVWSQLSQEFKINLEQLQQQYILEKKKFQNYCQNASSHHKLIHLKKIFEHYHLDMTQLNNYYQLYLESFNQSIQLYPQVLEFIQLCHDHHIKMYILTNNTCREQLERLQKMNMMSYFQKIYTSEEFGIEKPDLKLFTFIITDIGCSKHEIVKIGDNFKNDIEPLILNNMYAFWFHQGDFKIHKNYLEFGYFKELVAFFKNYFLDIFQLSSISRQVGERFDLVQAGGGNTSVKMDQLLFIKSSGCHLSNMNVNKNYVGVNFENIKSKLTTIGGNSKKEREQQSKQLVDSNIIFLKNYRPSIETTLHCVTHKYTVHLHPIQFNYISALDKVDQILEELFSDYCLIDYQTPGIEVTLELLHKYQGEKIIFMKNHGIVVTSDDPQEIRVILRNIIDKLESYLNLDFKKYHLVTTISDCLQQKCDDLFTSYLVENEFINSYINKLSQNDLERCFQSFFPDKVVYCGISCVFLKEHSFGLDIGEYMEKYKELPKIFIYISDKKHLYISSSSLNKCRDIEQVLLSHLICYQDTNIFLKPDEINYLNNWEAEKFRKNIN